MDYFSIVAKNPNKYGWCHLNNGDFGGIKWIRITAQEVIHLYAAMFRISIEPQHIGGYASYFEWVSRVRCGQVYTITIKAYRGCASKCISISNFRNIRSVYHLEFGESSVGDKCHQLRFMIWCINWSAAITFYLVPNEYFDERGIVTCSCFSCVRKYTKDKPEKSRTDFFLLAESKYYFFRHLDMYQRNNAGKIDIHHCAKQLPTKMKAVINYILALNFDNDHCGARKIFLDNRYAWPELFTIIFE